MHFGIFVIDTLIGRVPESDLGPCVCTLAFYVYSLSKCLKFSIAMYRNTVDLGGGYGSCGKGLFLILCLGITPQVFGDHLGSQGLNLGRPCAKQAPYSGLTVNFICCLFVCVHVRWCLGCIRLVLVESIEPSP